jgi:hypothetical protein
MPPVSQRWLPVAEHRASKLAVWDPLPVLVLESPCDSAVQSPEQPAVTRGTPADMVTLESVSQPAASAQVACPVLFGALEVLSAAVLPQPAVALPEPIWQVADDVVAADTVWVLGAAAVVVPTAS